MNPQLLPATARDDVPAWQQTVVAFLAEKERRSGSRRTVEGYARMLWPFFDRVGSPDKVTPAHVLAWSHGIGASGREPSSATVGAHLVRLPAINPVASTALTPRRSRAVSPLALLNTSLAPPSAPGPSCTGRRTEALARVTRSEMPAAVFAGR